MINAKCNRNFASNGSLNWS